MFSKLKSILLRDDKKTLRYILHKFSEKFEYEVRQECLRSGFSKPTGTLQMKVGETVLYGHQGNQFNSLISCAERVVKKHSADIKSIGIAVCSGEQDGIMFARDNIWVYNDGYYEEMVSGEFKTFPIKGSIQEIYKPNTKIPK